MLGRLFRFHNWVRLTVAGGMYALNQRRPGRRPECAPLRRPPPHLFRPRRSSTQPQRRGWRPLGALWCPPWWRPRPAGVVWCAPSTGLRASPGFDIHKRSTSPWPPSRKPLGACRATARYIDGVAFTQWRQDGQWMPEFHHGRPSYCNCAGLASLRRKSANSAASWRALATNSSQSAWLYTIDTAPNQLRCHRT